MFSACFVLCNKPLFLLCSHIVLYPHTCLCTSFCAFVFILFAMLCLAGCFWFPLVSVTEPCVAFSQVSQSQEHQQYITFLQRLLGPLLEAYSSAVIFVHNFSGPVLESEFIQKLHRHLISRTEKNVAVYGMLNCFWNWV